MHDWCYLDWPISKAKSYHHSQVLWTRGLLIRRNSPTAISPTSPPGVRRTSIKTLVSVEGHRWRSRIASRQPKTSSARPQRIQILARLASSRFARHARLRHDGAIQHQANKPAPKKTKSRQRQNIRSHPLVDPGNPPHSPTSRAKAHPTRRCHRMVALAARSSGRITEISSQTKITTVMLGSPSPLRVIFYRLATSEARPLCPQSRPS